MSKMRIVIDPRMELLTALQLVAGDSNINRDNDDSYYKEMLSWFIPYQDHQAVAYYKKINEYFSFDAPVNSMLYTEFKDELRLVQEPAEYYCLRAGSKRNWMEFITGLQDYARKTQFKTFFENHTEYYRQTIEKVASIIGNCDPVSELESYLGLYADHYTFRFSPLQTCGYAGWNVQQIEEVSCTIGFNHNAEDDRAEICLRIYLWHEFAHFYLNPIIDEFMSGKRAEWNEFEKFVSSLQIDTEKYPIVNHYECFVRAVTNKLTSMFYGNKEAEDLLRWEEEHGFVYIKKIIEALDKYDIARGKEDINIKDFFPVLLREITDFSRK